MAVTIDGTTGVSLVQDGVITDANLPAGSMLQVVSATKTDTFSITTSSFTDVTGLSVSITPSSSSSKILIFAYAGGSGAASGYSAAFRFLRDSTPVGVADAAGDRKQATFRFQASSDDHTFYASAMHLDSPSSTSALTYKLQMARQSGSTMYLNRTGSNADTSDPYNSRSISGITVMEIAG